MDIYSVSLKIELMEIQTRGGGGDSTFSTLRASQIFIAIELTSWVKTSGAFPVRRRLSCVSFREPVSSSRCVSFRVTPSGQARRGSRSVTRDCKEFFCAGPRHIVVHARVNAAIALPLSLVRGVVKPL